MSFAPLSLTAHRRPARAGGRPRRLVMLLHGLSWLTCVWLVWVWLWAFAAGGCNPLGGTATTPELSAPCST